MQQIQEEFANLKLDSNITGFIYCEDFDKHFSNKKHYENPKRTQSIDQTIQNYLYQHDAKRQVEQLSQFNQCEIQYLRLVYDQAYIDFVEGLFEEVGDQKNQKEFVHLNDTYLCKTSAFTARKCVQAVLEGADRILTKEWRNAFCSVRPPGHHSGHKAQPTGFCIYNNVAIAAKYARLKHKVNKILIFDWDVHHCDGTESVFYEDPNTLVISIHRYDEGQFYPRSGDPEKIGGKNAEFKNVNVGWNVTDGPAPGYDDYVYAFDRLLGPIIKEFAPDFIIISAGYDSAKGDPLGCIDNTPQGYQYITEKLSQICPKVLAVLEGGYNLDVTADCALATLQQLMRVPQEFPATIQPTKCGVNAVTTTVDKHKEFWTCLTSNDLMEYQKKYIGQTADLISGGHLQSFQIKDDVIIKTTKKGEFQFYSTLNDQKNPFYEENQRLIRFMPKLISLDQQSCSITMENLTYGLENGSIIDLKMGYKTYNPNGSALKKEKEIKKAKSCDQIIMGFRIAGVKIRDQIGALTVNKNGSDAYKWIRNDKQMKDIIEQVFLSNYVEKPNKEALQGCIKFIQELIEALQTSKRVFRNTSILIIVDNMAKKFRIKWIDFNYVMKLSDDCENPDAKVDNNILGGLKYLLSMLRQIDLK